MMSRFCLALGSDVAELLPMLRDRLAQHFPHVAEQRDGALFCEGSALVIDMPAVDGWLVGRIFGSAGCDRLREIPSPLQRSVESTNGRSLLKHVFGSYVAIWREGGDGAWQLMRDPSATQPVLFHHESGFTIIGSDVASMEATGLVPLRIDWPMVAHQLRYSQVPTAQTCLVGISELLPGQCARLDPEAATVRQVWSPWTFRRPTRDAEASPATLHRLAAAVDAAVAAWTNGFDRIGLELSGGLDSSILASALDRAKARWTGITFATEAADGDERPYARLVTQRFGVELREQVLGNSIMAIIDPPTRLMARPGGASFFAGLDRLLRAESDAIGADAMFSGGGGDNVFCSIGSTAPVIDARRAGGLALARRTFGDVAAATGSTLWQVGTALGHRWLADSVQTRQWLPEDRFLAGDVRPSPEGHPWLDLPPGTPPGLRAHIAAILRSHPVLTAQDRFFDRRYAFPLLSQPVLEACLSVPSWQWVAGGRDRAAVRDAFADRLPPAIVARRRKGRVESLTVRAYDRSRPELAVLLEHGLLAGAGLLDVPAILDCLSRPAQGGEADYARILALADAELWARGICGRSRA